MKIVQPDLQDAKSLLEEAQENKNHIEADQLSKIKQEIKSKIKEIEKKLEQQTSASSTE